jgi:hypothetical protein
MDFAMASSPNSNSRGVVMGFRVVAVVTFGAVVIAGFVWAHQPAPTTNPIRVPGFNAPVTAAATPDPARRDTLLPTNCEDLLAGSVDMAALLGQPVGSVTSHAVVGMPSASVGQLERLTSNYAVPGRPVPTLVLTVAGFTDPAAAAAQRDRNIAAERADTRSSHPVAMGAAQASVLSETDRTMLFVADDRNTLTAALIPGVALAPQTEPILVDLAQRMLPNLTATGAGRRTLVRH